MYVITGTNFLHNIKLQLYSKQIKKSDNKLQSLANCCSARRVNAWGCDVYRKIINFGVMSNSASSRDPVVNSMPNKDYIPSAKPQN